MVKSVVIKEPPAPKRQVILDAIQDHMDQVYSLGSQIAAKRINVSYASHAFDYIQRAEALIELLEVFDCGSSGGFDPRTNNKKHDSGTPQGLYSLEERFDALKRLYAPVKPKGK